MAIFNQRDQYSQLSAQIEQKFLENRQTTEIYEQKNQWRAEIEGIIKEMYPGSQLVLSGSSANGFGSVRSDIDLVLCLEGSAATPASALRRIDTLFTRNRRRFRTEVRVLKRELVRGCSSRNRVWISWKQHCRAVSSLDVQPVARSMVSVNQRLIP